MIGNTAHNSKHEEVNEKNYEDFIKESQSQLKLAAPTSRQNQQRFFLPVSSPNRYIPSRVHLSQISMTNNSLSVIDDNFSATSLSLYFIFVIFNKKKGNIIKFLLPKMRHLSVRNNNCYGHRRPISEIF